MEVVTGNESTTRIGPGQTREIGRDHGVDSSDKTISRRHISLSVAGASNRDEIRLRFEVLGRNPIYVLKDNELKIFRRFERGDMGNGDMFCFSVKNPVWHSVRRIEDGVDCVRRNAVESEFAGKLEISSGFNGVEDLDEVGVNISGLDPVKEFGFVVEGHEFDSYPTKMIRDIKNWDWFLEEKRKTSEDEEKNVIKGGGGRGKRKRGAENDDEEWSAESEDERVLVDKSRKAKYMTRSKDHGKTCEKSSTRTKNRDDDDEDEDDEDEDDETLGGFVVDDENLEEEEEGGELEEDDGDEEELEDEFDEDE